jgi:hypothetical protein
MAKQAEPTNRLKRIIAELRRPETSTDNSALPGLRYWGEHPKATLEEWQIEVKNGDTRRGYWAWVRAVLGDE